MSAERFVHDARAALAALAGAGAVSAGKETVAGVRGLAARARGLGLVDLGAHLDGLAAGLERRGELAFEASQPLAAEICAVFDRVEALASALALWSVERVFTEPR